MAHWFFLREAELDFASHIAQVILSPHLGLKAVILLLKYLRPEETGFTWALLGAVPASRLVWKAVLFT